MFSSFFLPIFFLTVISPFVTSILKLSRLPISIARLSPISPLTSSQIFILKFAKKIYIIVNDLYRKFAKKSRLINLFCHQNRFFFSFFINICNFVFLFVFLFVKSTKIEFLTLYHDSAKCRFAHLFFASSRFFTFDFFSVFLSRIIVFCYFYDYFIVYFVNKNIFCVKTKNKKRLKRRKRRFF